MSPTEPSSSEAARSESLAPPANSESADHVAAAFALLQPRVKLPSEIVPQGQFLFADDFEYDPKAVEKKLLKEGVFHSTEGREADQPEAGQQRNEVKWQTLEKITGIFQGLENRLFSEVCRKSLFIANESGRGGFLQNHGQPRILGVFDKILLRLMGLGRL